jgi:hypothetical protein
MIQTWQKAVSSLLSVLTVEARKALAQGAAGEPNNCQKVVKGLAKVIRYKSNRSET